MYIARFALITFVAFALMMGCGMVGKEAEMTQETSMAMEDAESMDKVSVPTPKKSAYRQVTFNVEGMT